MGTPQNPVKRHRSKSSRTRKLAEWRAKQETKAVAAPAVAAPAAKAPAAKAAAPKAATK